MRPPALLRALSLLTLPLLGCGAADVPCPRPELGTGTLVIEQLHLAGPSIGIAKVVHLPDGRRFLVEVGNDAHDGAVRDATDGAVDFVLVTHDDQDHAGGREQLADVLEDATDVSALGVHDLGAGVTLDVFLADGVLALRDGPPPFAPGTAHEPLDLRTEVDDIDGADNPRSVAAVLRYGDFAWLFAGDLTGGGKGTPDVESAVALRGDQLVVPGEIDLVSLNHHGIRSSNNDAWLAWLLPDDRVERHALVATSPAYLAAPNEDVLDAIAPRLQGGAVWTGKAGSLTPSEHAALRETGDGVFVRVDATGWSVCGE